MLKEADNEMVIVKLAHDKGMKSFWNGIAWMGTKAQAVSIKKSEVAELERKWRIRAKQFPAKRTK